MQSAETVLGVLRERGRRGLPCNELYRQMFNPELYLLAYGRIYSNKGAMTPGATAGNRWTACPWARSARIIDAMRHERYRFSPVRRVIIPKKNGKLAPAGPAGWSDKLVGEVVRLLLEAYYEPPFSDRSHGFRPGRGCHTALREVANTWTGTTWFIEGDIADCFGSLDHEVMSGDPGGEDPRQPVPAAGAQHADGRIPGGLGMECHAVRGSAGRCCFPDPVQHLSAQVGRVRREGADPGIHPRGRAGQATPPTARCRRRSYGPANAATAPRRGHCAGSCAACRARILTIPATGGCATAATPTTTCSGSPGRRPKPRRSSDRLAAVPA